MRITDLPILPAAEADDILYIVDKSDTSDFLSGSSKQITVSDLVNSVASTAAESLLLNVKNTSGAIIPKGSVVRIVGVDNASSFGTIELADFSNEYNSANTLGLTYETFAINAFGYVITSGYLTGVDTETFTAGDLLFLSSSGTYTNVPPIAPKHSVRLGEAIRINKNNGSIYVRIDNGQELGESHNVIDNTTTSSYGDLLVKSGSVWINSRILTGSYVLSGSLTAFVGNFNELFASSSTFINVTASNISASTTLVAKATTLDSLTVYSSSIFYGDVTIYGTGSTVNISSSTVIIGDNRIQLNAWSTGSFSQRYAGLDLTDSGSNNNVTSSLLWDSLNNYWLLTNNQTGSAPIVTSSALILQGPVSNFGNEKQFPINTFLKTETAIGNLTSSRLTETGSLLHYNGTITSSAVIANTGSFITFNINTTGSAPTSITASGMVGEVRFDNNYMYVYTNNRWVRTPIAEWT